MRFLLNYNYYLVYWKIKIYALLSYFKEAYIKDVKKIEFYKNKKEKFALQRPGYRSKNPFINCEPINDIDPSEIISSYIDYKLLIRLKEEYKEAFKIYENFDE